MKLSLQEVAELKKRVESEQYRQYVKRVELKRVRGFVDETIEYRYPVTALIGTNGGGKSTILGATALAYKTVKPSQFFPKSFAGDDSMSDWQIEIELVDKPINNSQKIRRSARFTQLKWRRDDLPERHVEYIEIQRTVPAGELSKFRKFIGQKSGEIETNDLTDETIKYATAILDKDISDYKSVNFKSRPSEKLYIGTSGLNKYSQFHFGAGEASIIQTVDRIERSPDNSLILIEEVENGLHPIAVRLFVDYLQSVAKRKRLQVVFTTHSQDAVDQLPAEGIWACINSKIWNGKLSIESLRAVSGQVDKKIVLFVEDKFAQEWVENAARRYANDLVEVLGVYPAGGYPSCLTVTAHHNNNPVTKEKALVLVDGDMYDPATNDQLPAYGHFLGGGVPESTVFQFIYDKRIELAGLIQQRCLLSGFEQDRIVAEIESVMNAACDPHVIFDRLGERFAYASALQIRSGFIDIFNERNPLFWEGAIAFIRNNSNHCHQSDANGTNL